MRLKSVTSLAVVITLLFPVALFAANPKAGAKCSKVGKTQVFAGKKFFCTKSGKNLVWDKGVLLPSPKPSSTPVNPSTNSSMAPSVAPSSTSTPIQKTSYTESKKFASADECKLKDVRIKKTNPNNVGFPLTPGIFGPNGTMKLIVVPVDFSDAVGDDFNLDKIERQINALKNWYDFVSGGKISVDTQYIRKWFRAKSPSSEYLSEIPQVNGQMNYMDTWNKYAQEFIDITGNSFDFNEVKGIIWHFPDNQKTNIKNEILGRGILLKTPAGNKNLFYWASGSVHYELEKRNGSKTLDYWAALWVHELLHSQGLPLHAPGNGFESGVGQNQGGSSWMLDGWETFKLGWIEDNEVFCVTPNLESEAQIILNPLEVKDVGNKLAIVKLSDTRALVIESRRPVGLSKGWDPSAQGIYAYVIDTTKDNDRSKECCGDSGNDTDIEKWAYYIQPDGISINSKVNTPDMYKKYLIREGQKVTFEGFQLIYLQKSSRDVIQVRKL